MLYQPRCIVAFDAQQKHNISSFRNFASVILKFFEKFVGFQGKLRKIKGKNRGWTGVLVVGQVRQVGQVGQVNWYAMCQSPTIKPAGLLARKHRRLAYWSTRSRTGRTCRTSRTGGLVCRVPIANKKNSRVARAENTADWQKNRRQAEKKKNYHSPAGRTARRQAQQPTTSFSKPRCSSRRMYRAARSTSNQGGGEGVDSRPQPNRRPPI